MNAQPAPSGLELQLTVPAGWTSESFVNSVGMGIYRIGSFPFPANSEDDVGQTARAAMQPSDVLINIVDLTATDPGTTNAAYVPTSTPIVVDPSDVRGQEGYPLIVQAAIRGVRIFERNLHISVAFGGEPSTAQLTAANLTLKTLAHA